jgi:negative regulator of flagellin synthesis FlgM
MNGEAMKINLENLQGTNAASNVGGNAKPAAGKAPEQTQNAEKIQISELSRQLHAFESSVAAAPDFDTKRVDEIKQAISEGRFTVNSDAVADKLLASVQELLIRQK